jgi:hypothetical protein
VADTVIEAEAALLDRVLFSHLEALVGDWGLPGAQ